MVFLVEAEIMIKKLFITFIILLVTNIASAAERINVAYTIDNNYVTYMLLSVNSILKNNKTNSDYTFYILETGITQKNKNFIKNYIEKRHQKVEFISVDDLIPKDIELYKDNKNSITPIAIARIFIPEIIEKNIEKVLYIDADTLITEDLSKLYNLDLSDNYAGMIIDKNNKIWRKYFNLDSYYNSGVILINVPKWRENKLTPKLLTYMYDNIDSNSQYTIEGLDDQNIINIVLENKIQLIPTNWNNQVSYSKNDKLQLKVNDNFKGLIHYSSKFKPWLTIHESPANSNLYKIYYNYWNTSGIKGTKYLNMLKNIYKSLYIHKIIKNTEYIIVNRFFFEDWMQITREKYLKYDSVPSFAIQKTKNFINNIASIISDKYSQMYNKKFLTSDIDLVYTWVDGNDPIWQKEKEKYAKLANLPINNFAAAKERFEDHDELKYSLRSVEKFMPWVHKIYIVTNGQIPEWLNLNHPKIKIVTHEQILEKSALPTFNSMAIETGLQNIPELSEYFIYSNDDFFVKRPLTPGYFFNKSKKPILRMRGMATKYSPWDNEASKFHIENILYTSNIFLYKFNEIYPYTFVHTMAPYRKSDYITTAKIFEKEFKNTMHAKFRKGNLISRVIVYYYELYNKSAILKKNSPDLIIHLSEIYNFTDFITENNFPTFCVEDDKDATTEDKKIFKAHLQKLYPQKSSFEK